MSSIPLFWITRLELHGTATILYSLARAIRTAAAEASRQLRPAAASNQRAVDLSTALYTRGLTDFLNVLDAERNLFQTQSDLAQSETSVSTDLVALHKALGGGWDAYPVGKP